ncbi:glutathionylspermidine synthase family protein [Bacillus sp. ISL-35]|uniref:glutathionylspermidine synthase family protein n=1 Tax=Bacillus sp. ISL-35 TaxID=2819122 RepID=UPI001BE5A845|nr:glutathionylspermidine synthase family protein [Bacillus sp. ISL-35]MBT2680999.1 glutathionylspermidine synthase family protein [Bacillus sp. ISL-35]MBT2705318.1 glutathionylspermidine synthase family protein [Chryseobacterium sp. ISL-80]
MEDHRIRRRNFYRGIRNFWPDLYGEEYALYDVAAIPQKEADEIRLCTSRIGKVFFKICDLLRKVDKNTLLDLGFPGETVDFIRLKTLNPESVIARLDLIKTDDTYKCIEINADTPTFIKELFHVNGLVAQDFGYGNPNESKEEQLALAVRKAIKASANWLAEIEPYVIFTAHEDNIEDKNTVLYLQELYGLPSRFISLDKLRIQPGEGLFDEDGRKIDILYRQTFPIESLVLDEDQSGNRIGLWLMDLIKTKKLAVINPPSAFLLQNKAVQAVIWGMHENKDPFFTKEEHQWIQQYFLPTYLEEDHFLEQEMPYVKKPIFGREGDTVQIFDCAGQLVLEEQQRNYDQVPSIFQQYIKLPSAKYLSEKGIQDGHILTGSFLVYGEASAFGYRVGGKITNNLSCFLPAGLTV